VWNTGSRRASEHEYNKHIEIITRPGGLTEPSGVQTGTNMPRHDFANTPYQLQENVIIAALRRPTLGSTIKGAGVSERHFPVELRPAFQIAMTKSQEEIRRLVTLKDPRIWPLYGKRIIEWSDGQMRTAARQLVDSPWSIEDLYPVSAVQPNNGSKSKSEASRRPQFMSRQRSGSYSRKLSQRSGRSWATLKRFPQNGLPRNWPR
jgi:hypothetical protein